MPIQGSPIFTLTNKNYGTLVVVEIMAISVM